MDPDCSELQSEELEALQAIYGLDEGFDVSTNDDDEKKVRVRLTAENGKTIVLDVIWGKNYPNTPPSFSLEALSNRVHAPETRQTILDELDAEANQHAGESATFMLVEWLRGELDRLLVVQTPDIVQETPDIVEDEKVTPKEKQRKKTKAEKRRAAKLGAEVSGPPRGTGWMDVVRHLSHVPHQRQNVRNL